MLFRKSRYHIFLVPALAALVAACANGESSPPIDAAPLPPPDPCTQVMCDDLAMCTVVDGAAQCMCPEGYAGDGTDCQDIDECAEGTDDCDPDAACTNMPGAFACACLPGFAGDGKLCDNIDECATANPCDANATCQDTEGSVACTCNDGFAGDGILCTDVDECAAGLADCDPNALCTNVAGSYECACESGYTGDGLVCTDIDECAGGGVTCDGVTECVNQPGSYGCLCVAGYFDEYGDGSSCVLRSAGRVYLIGHDFFTTNIGATRLFGNAVFSGSRSGDIQILAYVEYADMDPGQEVDRTMAVLTERSIELGRDAAITTLTDYTNLAAELPGKDVLLIFEQERGDAAALDAVGTSWAELVQAFVRAGGVVVVSDFHGETWRILQNAGLMNVNQTGTMASNAQLTVREPASPLGAGVGATYPAPSGTRWFVSNNAMELVEDNLGRSPVLMRTMTDECLVIEDFEAAQWPLGHWRSPNGSGGGTVSPGIQHDYGYGIQNPSWHYQTRVLMGAPGDRVSAWFRFTQEGGRGYLGFGSSYAGTFNIALAPSENRIILQESEGYLSVDLTSVNAQIGPFLWYRLEVEYGAAGQITARLYLEGVDAPIGTLTHTIPELATGGIAIRGIGNASTNTFVHIDTLVMCPAGASL